MKNVIWLVAAILLISASSLGAQAETCTNAPLPRLSIGESGRRFVGANNNIRVRPSLENSPVVGNLGGGERFDVIDGPVCRDGYYWWKITDEESEIGWVAEGQGFIYWLIPASQIVEIPVLPDNVDFRSRILFTALLEPQTPPVVVSIKPDGTDLDTTPIIPGAYNVFASRDYKQLGYDNRFGSVVTLNIDGSNIREVNLMGQNFNYGAPAWSPDFSRIAFSVRSDPEKSSDDLYVVSSDGLDLLRLTDTPETEYAPAWSPDANQIAFVRVGSSGLQLMVMSAYGGEATPLTEPMAYIADPAWSPDGSRIAYATESAVIVIDLAGRIIAVLGTDATVMASVPTWSPDGSKLAFQLRLDPEASSGMLFVANRDGSDLRRLTTGNVAFTPPGWSPDGKQLAFYGESNAYLTILRVDDQSIIEVPAGLPFNAAPVWLP